MLCLDDVFDAVDEHLQALGLRLEDLLGEHRLRVIEDLAQKAVHEALGDAVAQAAGEHRSALVLEVLQRFQVTALDQVGGVTLLGVDARPDFRAPAG